MEVKHEKWNYAWGSIKWNLCANKSTQILIPFIRVLCNKVLCFFLIMISISCVAFNGLFSFLRLVYFLGAFFFNTHSFLLLPSCPLFIVSFSFLFSFVFFCFHLLLVSHCSLLSLETENFARLVVDFSILANKQTAKLSYYSTVLFVIVSPR